LPRLLSILALVALALVVSDVAPATKPGALEGRVLRVISGDTLDVHLDGGAVDRVRLLGVVAPRAGSCFSRAATATTRALAGGRRVTLCL
jgi:endonuclease YncB( thermonuclease family)